MSSLRTQSARPNSRSRHAPKCVPAVWLAAIALVVFAACDTPGVTLIDPDVTNGPDSVTFHVTLEDTLLARALGWEDGVPGAEIQLHRVVDPFQPHILHTDSVGNAYISNLLPGLYKIAGYRVLSDNETGPTGGVIRAFGDGFKQELGSKGTVLLSLGADDAGSLVISEAYYGGWSWENYGYFWAIFAELYNNSDTTVYMDGMLFGAGFGRRGSANLTCESNQAFREDPAGLWTPEFHQFPGNGRDYPVAAGQVVVVAMDAVDHSQVDPTLPDLSHADFELEGSGDPDNPDVPNMPPRGPWTNSLGHGMMQNPTDVIFLAGAVDVTSLEMRVNISGHKYVRIPTEVILDVTHGYYETPDAAPDLLPRHYCLNWVNREFDRLEAVVFRPDDDNRMAMHRKLIRSEAGRPILQDLNTSRLDLVIGIYSPGRIEN